jgi:hypothetical protein
MSGAASTGARPPVPGRDGETEPRHRLPQVGAIVLAFVAEGLAMLASLTALATKTTGADTLVKALLLLASFTLLAAALPWMVNIGGPNIRTFRLALVPHAMLFGLLLSSVELADSGMSTADLHAAEAKIRASGDLAYFLGDHARGTDLDEIIDIDRSAEFWYGVQCDLAGNCGTTYSVSTVSREDWSPPEPCNQIEPILGVPAAFTSYDPSTNGPTVMVLTGDSIVRVGAPMDGAVEARQEVLVALAKQLRVVGGQAGTTLPPPSRDLLAAAASACPS